MEGGMIMTMMRAPEVAPRAEHQGHSKHLQRAQLLLLRRLRAMQLPCPAPQLGYYRIPVPAAARASPSNPQVAHRQQGAAVCCPVPRPRPASAHTRQRCRQNDDAGGA